MSKLSDCVTDWHFPEADTTVHANVRIYAADEAWTLSRPLCFECTEIAVENAVHAGLPYAVERIAEHV